MAAADCGQYGESPGTLLRLALDCISYSTLPYAGGVWDQPAGLMQKIRVLHNVYTSFHDMVNTRLDMKTWSERNEGMMRVVASVEKLRREQQDG